MSFKPSGIITLTTDFGHRGSYIGVMKGVIIQRCPSATIIDLTHECLVHRPVEAGFWIARSYSFFPEGTVHLAVVDPGVGTKRDLLIIFLQGHLFLGPNNGLFSEIAAKGDASVRLVSSSVIKRYGLKNESNTFHGRDILAPIAAALAGGELYFEDCGPECDDHLGDMIETPEFLGSTVIGQVVTMDNFGNLITNISRDHINAIRETQVIAGGEKFSLKNTYGDVKPGKFLALINSIEMLEIACYERNANEELGIGRGSSVKVIGRKLD